MGYQPRVRHCARCQGRLALDNTDRFCAACRRTASDTLLKPPVLPREFWLNTEMRAALDSWHMGRVIYAYRMHPSHGRLLPQELVGGWLNLTQAQLSRIESGRAPEELSKLSHWATTLGIPGDLLWFKLPSAKPRPVSSEGSSPVRTLPPSNGFGRPAMTNDNRSPMALLAALTADHLPSMKQDGAAPTLGIAAFDGLSLAQSASQLLTLFLQLDAQLGGDNLYAPLSQYVARLAVAVEANPADGLLAFGQLSQMAGWLALDGNRHGAARRFLSTAVYVGHETDEPGLAASALAYMSLQATYQGRLDSALSLAKTARSTDLSALTPLTRTMLATREARAHAGLGNAKDCLRVLDDVHRAYAHAGSDEEPLWLSYVDPIEVAAQEGACYLSLGMAEEADGALSNALGLLTDRAPHRVRDQVHYLSRLAKCHLLTPDVEQACAVATEALNLSTAIGSARVGERLGEFRTALAPFAQAAPAREFEARFHMATVKSTA